MYIRNKKGFSLCSVFGNYLIISKKILQEYESFKILRLIVLINNLKWNTNLNNLKNKRKNNSSYFITHYARKLKLR